MHVLAVQPTPGSDERLAAALRRILGLSVYEAETRVRVAAQSPLVASTFGDLARAEDSAAGLAAYGFATLVLGEEAIETDERRFLVRELRLAPQSLLLRSRQGEEREVRYADLELLLRGVRFFVGVRGEVASDSPREGERAARKGKRTLPWLRLLRDDPEERREELLHLYAPGQLPVVLRADSMLYRGLGAAMQASAARNFAYVAAEIRRACPQALYDDRLTGYSAQARLLGSASLSPQRHLDVAISVLARALRKS